jgi:chromate transporter
MLKLGTIAFGGPAVHVAMLREGTVRRRHWLEDAEFLDLFGAVSVLPGPSSPPAGHRARPAAGGLARAAAGRGLLHPARHGHRARHGLGLCPLWVHPTDGGVLYGLGPVVVALVTVWELARGALVRHRVQGRLVVAGLSVVGAAALGLMAGVTIDLGHAAITDPLTAAVAVAALGVVLRWRPNALWLVVAGAVTGIAHILA